MALFYGYRRLTKPDDWRGLAGSEKWVAGRSAYELAYAWQPGGGLPLSVAAVLDRAGVEPLRGLVLDLCLVEKPVFLDTRRAPSMTDLMAYGRNAAGEAVVVAVEGKADEPFALRTCAWLRGDSDSYDPAAAPRPSRVRRLEYLASLLGLPVDTETGLRYQLFHRTASAILEAELHGASAALVLVHAFGSICQDNWSDFVAFLDRLGLNMAAPGDLVGPFVPKGTPVYFLWHQSEVASPVSRPPHPAANATDG